MTRDLREAILTEAAHILRDAGPDQLSLREVARRLGVSHQAPYKHFASKDAVIAELARRAYAAFARHLEGASDDGDPHAALADMGRRYLQYAATHAFEYRLMFSMPLPDPAHHPEMLAEAHAAFDLLRDAIGRLDGRSSERLRVDALYVWSAMHGLAALLQSDVIVRLGLGSGVEVAEQVLARIEPGLTGADG